MSDRCNFSHWLALEGLRATPVRLAVLEILGEAPRALRAQEILELIRTRRRVNKVTVYRILEDFTRRGMVRKLSLEGRVNHFELACEHHPPHPHFQCQTCREVQCLEPVALNRVWTELRGPVGNRADHIDIQSGRSLSQMPGYGVKQPSCLRPRPKTGFRLRGFILQALSGCLGSGAPDRPGRGRAPRRQAPGGRHHCAPGRLLPKNRRRSGPGPGADPPGRQPPRL